MSYPKALAVPLTAAVLALGACGSHVTAVPVASASPADHHSPRDRTSCGDASAAHGEVATVVAQAMAFRETLTPPERTALQHPFARETAIRWSNLPIGIVPRVGVRLGDLDPTQTRAAQHLIEAALSACGAEMLKEVRLSDDVIAKIDVRHIGWGGGNYYLTYVGEPSERGPWMLQVGGHHIAYNLTFNGREAGATPLFFGTEPIRFTVVGTDHEPLQAQSSAMAALATALAKHTQAHLSGTFTDVVKGVVVSFPTGKPPVGGIDTGFPHSYPIGSADRGIRYGELAPGEQALARRALESYASLPGEALTRALVEAYEEPVALADTYVGYAGAADLSVNGSYVRIDGPRVWMEFVVQPGVANPDKSHYHALWRDKVSDYGGEVGR